MDLKQTQPGATLNRRENGQVYPVTVKRVTKRGIITLENGERFDRRGYPIRKREAR
ncbi:MAG: hypothetical protein PVS3B3_13840 [Ktedonobacteraceae bacterium]